MIGSIVFAILHARSDAWQIEHLGGIKAGKANSIVDAQRTALRVLAELLPTADHVVQAALRAT